MYVDTSEKSIFAVVLVHLASRLDDLTPRSDEWEEVEGRRTKKGEYNVGVSKDGTDYMYTGLLGYEGEKGLW